MKTKTTKNQKEGAPLRPMLLGRDGQNNSQTPTATPQKLTPRGGQQTLNSQHSTLNQSAKRLLPFVNLPERESNRNLPADKVLDTLRQYFPTAYVLAELVGKWVWVTFSDAPPEPLRAQLSQLGFHWNQTRRCWQHPGGTLKTEGSQNDPRLKYGSHFPADHKPA